MCAAKRVHGTKLPNFGVDPSLASVPCHCLLWQFVNKLVNFSSFNLQYVEHVLFIPIH